MWCGLGYSTGWVCVSMCVGGWVMGGGELGRGVASYPDLARGLVPRHNDNVSYQH